MSAPVARNQPESVYEDPTYQRDPLASRTFMSSILPEPCQATTTVKTPNSNRWNHMKRKKKDKGRQGLYETGLGFRLQEIPATAEVLENQRTCGIKLLEESGI